MDNPSKVIEGYVDNCQNCHLNLLDQVPVRTIRRQITELPEIQPVVIETWQHEVLCPCCGERQLGKLPEGLEAGRYFGPRLEALVTILHHEHHIGFERLVQICLEGALEIRLADQIVVVEAGNVAHLLRNIPHAIRNPLKIPSRYLFMTIPAGLDQWLDALETADREGTLDEALYSKLSLDYGIEWLE